MTTLPRSSEPRKLWTKSARYGSARKRKSQSDGKSTRRRIEALRLPRILLKKGSRRGASILLGALDLVPELVVALPVLDVPPEVEPLEIDVDVVHGDLLEILRHELRGLGVRDVVVRHLGDERHWLRLGHVVEVELGELLVL